MSRVVSEANLQKPNGISYSVFHYLVQKVGLSELDLGRLSLKEKRRDLYS